MFCAVGGCGGVERGDLMYINPFWAGVAATILFECIFCIVLAVIIAINSKDKK